MRAAWVAVVIALSTTACAYPRRSTSLSPVRDMSAGSSSQPADVWRFTVVGATVPPRGRGGTAWDDGDGHPDCFVRVFRDETLIFETQTIDDSNTPEWNATLDENLYAPQRAHFRFEIWDRDPLGADPVGIYNSVGMPPTAVPGAEGRIMMAGGAYLSIRIGNPQAYRGVGITSFEQRPGELLVVSVETHSPAGRAGIVPGDRIIAIGAETIDALGPQRAAGALSMASDRHAALRVRNEQGVERTVELDRGYTWHVR